MSLEIGYRKSGNVEYCLSFDDDGYYWYLHPLFEKLLERTGIYIDLYGDAKFNKGNINQIESLVKDARAIIVGEPEYWQVHCGTQTLPEKKEIYKKVSKRELSHKLDVLSEIIDKVKANDGEIIFEGD